MTVIDASVWVSRLVPQDVNHRASRLYLKQQAAQGQRLIAPVILLTEVAGAIARRTGSSQLARQAMHIVTIDHQLGQTATNLAAKLYLRGTDAIYVALAYRLGIDLVSWDKEQLERAGKLIQATTPEIA